MGTLVLGDWLVTAASEPPQWNHGIRVVDGAITAVGPNEQLAAEFPDDDVVSGGIVAPGFVNAHVHLYGVLAHGIPLANAPSGFWPFLEDFWWPKIEDALDTAMIATATEWVGAELLRSGVTSFYDILEAPHALSGALFAQKEVVERLGLRGVLSFEATQRVSEENAQLGLQENVDLIKACRRDANPLVTGLMCWHTTFTCSPSFVSQAVGIARDLGVRYHAHVNEGVHEGEWCERHRGTRTMELYDQLGIAGPQMIASQCVQMSPTELEIVAERAVNCVHMPLANCEVGGGIAPVPEQLALGVTTGLGSDGYVNDFFAVMRGAFLLHKGRLKDPGVMPAATVFDLATRGGARALGFEHVGELREGWRADVQVIDADLPTPVTVHNLFDQLVLWRNHTNVRDVMVDGSWRVRNGEVHGFDRDRVRARVHEQAERLWAKA
jgi:5-methylthioadenosine/S-adenosylhomocysteine deaminase